MQDYKKIAFEGLWKNNPGLVQLLGLCPLLAVTNTLVNAIGLGLATLFVLMSSNLIVSCIRHHVPKTIRLAIFVMVIAALVTTVQLLMNAYLHEIYLSLGIFLPLIVTNCIIIGRAESFASRQNPFKALFDGAMMGIGFMVVLGCLGAIRELLGQGTLFSQASSLFGSWGAFLEVNVFHYKTSFLVAMLPPGAFLAMGVLIAIKNWIDTKYQAQQDKPEPKAVERARVTGKV